MILYSLICYHLFVTVNVLGNDNPCPLYETMGHVDCREMYLSSIPENLPPQTKILDLTKNKIRKLSNSSFEKCPFLKELYISRNKIVTIEKNTFNSLSFLEVLDVSHNRLSHFNIDLPDSLEALFLNYNALPSWNALRPYARIRYLSLAGTNVTQLSNLSSILPSLQYLDLKGIHNLTVHTHDIAELRQLRTLDISPELFLNPKTTLDCHQFIEAARQSQIEILTVSCFRRKNFGKNGKIFQRDYDIDGAFTDHYDSVLNADLRRINNTKDLQNLASTGLANFIKSILLENYDEPPSVLKVNGSIFLENYSYPKDRINLTEVEMNGFPALAPSVELINEFGISEADELERYGVLYMSAGGSCLNISGNYRRGVTSAGKFLCTISDPIHRTIRQMSRRYGLLFKIHNVEEKIEYGDVNCEIHPTEGTVETRRIERAVLFALCHSWLNYTISISDTMRIDPSIRVYGDLAKEAYRRRILSKVMSAGITYLKYTASRSEVSPEPSLGLKDKSDAVFRASDDLPQSISFVDRLSHMTGDYNVTIANFFNFSGENRTEYSIGKIRPNSTDRVYCKYTAYYNSSCPAAIMIISNKNLLDRAKVFVESVEFKLSFDIKTINQVHHLDIPNVNATQVQLITVRDPKWFDITESFKTYLGFELAKEFHKTMTLLAKKVDFYSLNVL